MELQSAHQQQERVQSIFSRLQKSFKGRPIEPTSRTGDLEISGIDSLELVRQKARYVLAAEHSVIEAAITSIKVLNPQDAQWSEKVQASIAMIESAHKSYLEKLEQVQLLAHRETELLKTSGSIEERRSPQKAQALEEELISLGSHIRHLRHPVRRLWNGRQLREKQKRQTQAIDELNELRKQSTQATTSTPSLPSLLKQQREWLETVAAQTLQTLSDQLEKRYESPLGKEESQQDKEKTELVSQESITRLNQSLIAEAIESAKRYDSGIDEATETAISDVMQQAYAIPLDPDWQNAEALVTAREVKAKLENLPQNNTLSQFLIYGKESADTLYQEIALLMDQGEELLERFVTLSQYRDNLQALLDLFEQLPGEQSSQQYSKRRGIRDKLSDIKKEIAQLRTIGSKINVRRYQLLRNATHATAVKTESAESFERLLGLTLSDQLSTMQEHTRESVEIGERLVTLKTPEVIPLVALNAYREPGHSGEMPFLKWGYSAEHDRSIGGYLTKLTPAELAHFEALNDPVVCDAIKSLRAIILEHPNFTEQDIDNPRYLEALSRLTEDETFLDFLAEQLNLGPGYVIIPEDANYNDYNQDPFQPIKPGLFEELGLQLDFQPGDRLDTNDARFKPIRHALAKHRLHGRRIQPSYRDIISFETSWRGRPYCNVPSEKVKETFIRLGYPPELFNESLIKNPAHLAAKAEIVKLALFYLRGNDQRKKIFVLGTLERFYDDLPDECYEVLAEVMLENPNVSVVDELLERLAGRADHGDSRSLTLLVQHFDRLSSSAKSKVRTELPKTLGCILGNPEDRLLNSQEMVKAMAHILKITPEEYQRTIDLLRGLQDQRLTYFHSSFQAEAELSHYVKLSAYPQALNFIKSLRNLDIYWSVDNTPNTIVIFDQGQEESLLREIQEIKRYAPRFHYMLPSPSSASSRGSETVISSPYEQLTQGGWRSEALITLAHLRSNQAATFERCAGYLYEERKRWQSNETESPSEEKQQNFKQNLNNLIDLLTQRVTTVAEIEKSEALQWELTTEASIINKDNFFWALLDSAHNIEVFAQLRNEGILGRISEERIVKTFPAIAALEPAQQKLYLSLLEVSAGNQGQHQKFFETKSVVKRISSEPAILNDLIQIKEVGLLDKVQNHEFILENLDRLLSIAPERRAVYWSIVQRINESPSQEIIRLKDQLSREILTVEDPEAAYQRIESVFIRNNLPTMGKVYNVFSILHPEPLLSQKLVDPKLSPCLRLAPTNRERHAIIYRDLLRVHIQSGNRSLREYLECLKNGESILQQLDQQPVAELDLPARQQLRTFIALLNTLQEQAIHGVNAPTAPQLLTTESTVVEIQTVVTNLRRSLRVREGQSLNERVGQIFLRPIGLRSIDQALEAMQTAKTTAHKRGLAVAEEIRQGTFQLEPGALIKGVGAGYASIILQNGSVAREYLGASADSDMTPFDTDLAMVLPQDIDNGLEGILKASPALRFGDLLFVVRDRGQFYRTSRENVSVPYDPDRFELFHTGVWGERHFGIRTGFPTTEIDCMIAQPEVLANSRLLENLFYEIAQNGYYIPITDQKGTLIFSPEAYEQYRTTFAGLDRYDGGRLEISDTSETDSHYSEIVERVGQMENDREDVEKLYQNIRQTLLEVLADHQITLKEPFDRGLLGAELLSTGSTGRGTNKLGDYDFDLTLKLDTRDMDKAPLILRELVTRLQPERLDQYSGEGEVSNYLLRAYGARGISEQPLDIDISIIKKSELSVFGTYKALEEKMAWIERELGPATLAKVRANIVLAKEVLGKYSAYKQKEHGGLGGVGVENWILANEGNMLSAFESFWQAAHDGSNLIPFEEFKRRYKVLNAGVNMRNFKHDNYITDMKEEGYQATIRAIEAYWETHGVEKPTS